MQHKLYFVIAAYNEGTAISGAVADALTQSPHVVVVDDGSRDETARVALAAGAVVLKHPINLGQGAALQTGIEYALQQQATHIVTFDADGQHDAADIPKMLEIMQQQQVSIVLGSRFLGQAINMKASRGLVLRLATLFTRVTTGLKLTDTHNGLRLYSCDAAQKIKIRMNRMAHASEILSQIARLHIAYAEAPVTIRYTDYSKGKGQASGVGSLRILKDLLVESLSR